MKPRKGTIVMANIILDTMIGSGFLDQLCVYGSMCDFSFLSKPNLFYCYHEVNIFVFYIRMLFFLNICRRDFVMVYMILVTWITSKYSSAIPTNLSTNKPIIAYPRGDNMNFQSEYCLISTFLLSAFYYTLNMNICTNMYPICFHFEGFEIC